MPPTPEIRSALRDLPWPAVPEEINARMLALQFQYEQSERWPEAEIEAQQFRQLEALVAFCDRAIPFWRDRLRRAGLRGGQKLTRQLWSRLPVLTWAEMQAAGPQLRPAQLPPGHGAVLNTDPAAMAVPAVTSELARFFQHSIALRQALWHGVAFGAKLAVIDAAIRPASQGWGDGFAAFATGPAVHLDIAAPLDEQLAWLIREQPAYLRTPAAHAVRLARHGRDAGEPLPGQPLLALRAILSSDAAIPGEALALCQAVFGARVIAAYATDTAGILALPCPEHAHLHVVSDNVRLEVLNDKNQPCGAGEIGRVVVTPLHNFAMPLLRCDLGDDAEIGTVCSCGRTLPVLTRILPRADVSPRGVPKATR